MNQKLQYLSAFQSVEVWKYGKKEICCKQPIVITHNNENVRGGRNKSSLMSVILWNECVFVSFRYSVETEREMGIDFVMLC